MGGLVFLIVIGTSIWVLVDAKSLGFGKRQLHTGRTDSGPWVWFFGCLLLWIVAFPMYLVKRGRYKRELESAPTPAFIPSVPLATSGADAGNIPQQIERLADLHRKKILSDEEFATKKAELLSRL